MDVLGLHMAALGSLLGRTWALLGPTRELLGATWELLAATWELLGATLELLAAFWDQLGASRAPFGLNLELREVFLDSTWQTSTTCNETTFEVTKQLPVARKQILKPLATKQQLK